MRAGGPLLLLALAAVSPALAQGRPVAGAAQGVAADPALAERALRLAAILNSDKIVIGNAKSDTQALALAEQLWGSREELAALEQAHPGLSAALSRALMPIVNRSMRERLGALHRRQAALYAAHFSAAELDRLIAFYSSPTGTKLIDTMIARVKPDAVLREARGSETFQVSADAVLSDIRATQPAIVAVMDASDKAELMKLMASGLLPRMRALAPESQTLALDWMNEDAPWEAAETEATIQRVLARFGLARSGWRRAGTDRCPKASNAPAAL